MKTLAVLLLLATSLAAHDLTTTDSEALRAHILEEWKREHFQVASTASSLQLAAAAVANAAAAPETAKAFLPFTQLDLRADGEFLYVGSNGLADHNMMVGITNWQQQVPLPQKYFDDNAWRIPLKPVPAKTPAMIKGRFLRGAIALAVNGVPIFNPQNNRGEIAQEIGELDQWGGHCGRADDYHYHITPLHLQAQAGKGMPVAYALDGYPIYGLTEPDGSPTGKLDECHGHDSPSGYHYHASTQYPYVIGGFHGEVVERDGQVDPQPRANPVRPALPPLRGAKITGFESTGRNSYKLSYTVGGETRSIAYTIGADGSYPFTFDNGRDGEVKETYTARQGGGAGGPPREGGEMRPRDANGGGRAGGQEAFVAVPDQPRSSDGRFMLNSPVVGDMKALPTEFTGDGAGISPPLEWTGAPAGTQSYALIMDHLDPEGVWKWYWTLYDIPASTTSLPKNVKGVGKLGTGFKGQVGYEPPHSKGPGAKTYTLTVYALSAAPQISVSASQVNREVLFAAIKGSILDTAELKVTYTRNGAAGDASNEHKSPMRLAGANAPSPREQRAPPGGQRKPWLQQHGEELDADNDGTVTLVELTSDMDRAFAVYDTDKDGSITKAELAATGDVRDGSAFAGLIYRHFPDLDTTGDGNVSHDEMVAAARYVFNAADLDHDSRLSTAEWQSAPNTPLPVGSAPPPPPSPVAGTTGQPPPHPDAKGGKGKGGKGGPDTSGLIKPGMTDTIKVNVYADNWFVLYINGKLTAVDSIDFIPHNVVTVDILPEYPMTIAVMAKDNADANTGMEYGDHIGDGGFIIKFADGTVSNATWKAKNFFKGPLNHDAANPKVEHTSIPENWFAVDFDDRAWPNATEYTEERVNPKEPYFNADFIGAKWIWSEDLELDNTVIFRTKVEKPGWTKRWNTKPDIDVNGAPFK